MDERAEGQHEEEEQEEDAESHNAAISTAHPSL